MAKTIGGLPVQLTTPALDDKIPVRDVSEVGTNVNKDKYMLLSQFVLSTTNQTVAGVKTFSSAPVVPSIAFSNGNYTGFGVQGSTVSVSTSATNILAMGSRMSLNMVYGRSGSNYFCDVLLCMAFGAAAQAQVIGTLGFGSPASRTYNISMGTLTLAMASGTYNVQAGQIFRIADP